MEKKSAAKNILRTTSAALGITAATTPAVDSLRPTTPGQVAPDQPVVDNAAKLSGTEGPKVVKGDCRVMPLGDSLTAFGESYRGPLYRTLKAEGLKIDFVGSGSWQPIGGGDPDSEGHGGFRIGPDDAVDYQNKPANLDSYIAEWLTAAKPHVILLSIGTNDLAAGGAIADAAAPKLQALVTKIRQLAPDAYLAIGDIPPNTTLEASPQQQAINQVARKAGGGADPKVSYADTAKRLLTSGFTTPAHTNDGTHFTIDGGVLYAKAWYPAARAAIRAACGS